MENKEKHALLFELNRLYEIDDLDISAVNLEISPEDDMFVKENEDHYFNVGLSGLKNILNSLSCAQIDKSEIKTILDFPSGWGRELRFIKAYLPHAEITAGEIQEGALRFCRDQFGVDTLLSHNDFSRIPSIKKIDLIWCGSLITHLNKNEVPKLLDYFYDVLNDNGMLSFTSHGRYSKHLIDTEKYMYDLEKADIEIIQHQYESAGYGYVDYTGCDNYGLSVIKPSWLMELLEKNESWTIILYKEKGYDNHQDVITCLKRPIANVPKRSWFDRWIAQHTCPKSLYDS